MKIETPAEMRNRSMRPGELRAYRVDHTSTIISIQRTDAGQSWVVMVEKSGVLVDDLRASFDSEAAARLLARAYIALERMSGGGLRFEIESVEL